MQSVQLPKSAPFSYPVYLLSRSQIAEVKDEKELREFESWILYDETRRNNGGDTRPFDANFVLLSHRDVFFGGGALDLYIDKKRDHSEDPALMKSLLVAMLTFANEKDEEDDSENGLEGEPVEYERYETKQLLQMALQQCAEL